MNDHPADQQLVEGEVLDKLPVNPPPLPLVDQIANAFEQIDQQNRHIAALHRVVDQLIDELNRQTGTNWRPDLLLDVRKPAPEMQVTADHTRRGRRAEAKFEGGQQ